MTTTTACCAQTIPLHRPWWQRAWETLRESLRAGPDDPYRELRHLNEQTLRDIGAPPGLHESRVDTERWRLDVRNW